jgi:hypothetical protein
MKFNWPLAPGREKITRVSRGDIPMPELADQNIERLSHLFASGNLSHAREIAQRLGEEIGEPPRERPEFGLISRLLAAAALGKQPA